LHGPLGPTRRQTLLEGLVTKPPHMRICMLTRIRARAWVESMGPKKAAPSPVAVSTSQPFNLDRVVSENEAAAIIGYSKDTLRREFRAGRAPPRIRLSGRRIGYRLSAIYAFLEAHTEKPSAMP
jgi:predicted DNA-binding transcriptional regulator AlpA